MRLRHNFPIYKEKQYGWYMTTTSTAIGFNSNETAKLRLRVLELFERSGWDAVKIAFPGIKKRTMYHWRKRYLESGRKLTSLIPKSTRPHWVRQMVIPAQILGFIKKLREKYPKLSKYKIKPYLDIYCEENNLAKYSDSWIGKVINRHQFFFNVRKPVRRKRRTLRNKQRIKRCPRDKDIKLGYLQLDGIHVVFEGISYYFISAIELKTRQGFAKRVTSLSSRQAKVFLEEIQAQIVYPIHTIQTDNGSEFEGEFNQAIQQLKLKHLWSYPKSPKTQGYVERFNWTLQDEFINYQIDKVTYAPQRFDLALLEWLHYYNAIRPHQSLNYMTPNQYLLQLQKTTPCAKCV
jgi:putative transposase